MQKPIEDFAAIVTQAIQMVKHGRNEPHEGRFRSLLSIRALSPVMTILDSVQTIAKKTGNLPNACETVKRYGDNFFKDDYVKVWQIVMKMAKIVITMLEDESQIATLAPKLFHIIQDEYNKLSSDEKYSILYMLEEFENAWAIK
jgi:hypothetical protein